MYNQKMLKKQLTFSFDSVLKFLVIIIIINLPYFIIA